MIDFLKQQNITEAELIKWRIPGYVSQPERKILLSDVIDESFEDILTTYRQTLPEPVILKHDNSMESTGRHISPGIVSITDVVAGNLVCDVIDGSCSASDNTTTARQGFIMYSFTPNFPPGFLIVQEPINPVFLRCHNPWLSRINFKLTNQSEYLLDIRREMVSIFFLVNS